MNQLQEIVKAHEEVTARIERFNFDDGWEAHAHREDLIQMVRECRPYIESGHPNFVGKSEKEIRVLIGEHESLLKRLEEI